MNRVHKETENDSHTVHLMKKLKFHIFRKKNIKYQTRDETEYWSERETLTSTNLYNFIYFFKNKKKYFRYLHNF